MTASMSCTPCLVIVKAKRCVDLFLFLSFEVEGVDLKILTKRLVL